MRDDSDGDGVGVKACPPGVGGAVSPFGAVERNTMTSGIGFACLTNGSPAVIVASARALSVNNNRVWKWILSIFLNAIKCVNKLYPAAEVTRENKVLLMFE